MLVPVRMLAPVLVPVAAFAAAAETVTVPLVALELELEGWLVLEDE